MDKEDVIHTYNTILLIQKKKKNELMLFATTWMDLGIITPSETSQREKDRYCMIAPLCGI